MAHSHSTTTTAYALPLSLSTRLNNSSIFLSPPSTMADLYGLHPLDGNSYRSSSATTLDSLSLPANSPMASAYYSHLLPGFASEHFRPVSSAACDTAVVEAEIATARTNSEEESAGVIRAKIASHPLYPKLVDAFVNCQKVGVSPEFANILDQNNQGSDIGKETSGVSTSFGADPELDKFMGTYYGILAKYELDLSQSFVEASSFRNNMEMQLNMLCNGTTRSYVSDEAASEEDISAGEVELQDSLLVPGNEDRKLKDQLLRKYGGRHISSLKQEFSKTKKKENLPREARQILFDWWNSHSQWPYPTDIDKVELAESTGLNQKQINNWFINQRKRHWKLP